MDIIELAREIGKKIQEDERYLKMQSIQSESDKDSKLQELIGEFNLKRMSINNEVSAENKDEEKIQKLNDELRSLYSDIMSNENMSMYNDAKKDMDLLLTRINTIIIKSAQGEDPNTADYEESGCTGSCSSCGGCH